MIIIIEGLDGVGKTTIAKQISKNYNYEYIHESYTDDVKEKKERIIMLLLRLMENKNFIYDRTTLIDDFVYNFLNKTESDLGEYKKIILQILEKCKIFHLQLDEQIRKQRFDNRGDEYITNDDISQIAHQYELFYQQLSNVQYIQLTEDNEQNIEKIMRRLKND